MKEILKQMADLEKRIRRVEEMEKVMRDVAVELRDFAEMRRHDCGEPPQPHEMEAWADKLEGK